MEWIQYHIFKILITLQVLYEHIKIPDFSKCVNYARNMVWIQYHIFKILITLQVLYEHITIPDFSKYEFLQQNMVWIKFHILKLLLTSQNIPDFLCNLPQSTRSQNLCMNWS